MEVVVTTGAGVVQSCSEIITNIQHPVFYRPDVLPVAQPTVSKHWREICSLGHSTLPLFIVIQWQCNMSQSLYLHGGWKKRGNSIFLVAFTTDLQWATFGFCITGQFFDVRLCPQKNLESAEALFCKWDSLCHTMNEQYQNTEGIFVLKLMTSYALLFWQAASWRQFLTELLQQLYRMKCAD